MQLYSTNNPSLRVSFKEALFQGLPTDKGLFMPLSLPVLPTDFIDNLHRYSFQDIAFRVAHNLIGEEIPAADLRLIIDKAINFPAPVVLLDEHIGILELFHGPSMAFKDFGARFMAETMSWFNRGETRELTILVATSGDTGGAVAAGFYRTPGIRVIILYPSGKVSPLQEKQLTTLGHNISALEIEGTFDDCQALVKQAFLDPELTGRLRLSSANSINIARLIPQSFYYFEAFKQASHLGKPLVFSVPSGNFGNLTAGLLAMRMGLPVHHFIAATNTNDVVPQYLTSGEYQPRPSVRTLSNAMDVGAPSNFARMTDLYGSTWNSIKKDVSGFAFSDTDTEETIRATDQAYHYLLDPHAAVGYLALRQYQSAHPDTLGIVLETAHPAKFLEDMERILGRKIDIPERLADLKNSTKQSTLLPASYPALQAYLMQQA
ncbi:MAG: threonine synthase [Saprospiraceae bacterium]